MEEWKEYKAIDFCTNVTDGTHDSPKPKEKGRYLITSKHLQNNVIDFTSAYRISEEDYRKVIQRSKVEQYDILFSMIGTIGNTVRVVSPEVDFAVKNMAIFRMGGNDLKSKWLYYWLKSSVAKAYISSRLAGSTQSYLTLDALRNFPIYAPEERTMKGITDILSSFDDKIALNNRINHNLEEQAQALYKSWFIDFEPFKDGKFVNSELGMIPEGWHVATLGEVTSEMRNKVGIQKDVKVLSPVTTGQLVLSEEFFTKQVFSESIAKYLIVRPNDFAYNPARVNIGSLGKNVFDFDGCVSPVYVVFRCEIGYEHFFDMYRTTKPFKEEVISRSNGGVRQTLGYKDFALIKLVYPPMSVIKEFNTIYSHMLLGMIQCGKENMLLAKQRDELLPKLMTGGICIRDLTC